MARTVTPTPHDLVARIRALLPSLSPAEARLAQIIQADPAGVSALTVGELAERAATSTATVIRAARSLGFEGYPQLRLALAAHGGSVHGADGVPLGADIVEGDPAGVVLAKLAAFEAEQIRATAELVDPAGLERVIAAIGAARRIDVYGIGASGLVAEDLTQKLSRVGLDCRARTEHDAAMVSASLLGPRDIAIGVSHSGENPGTVKPLALARTAGAATAAITGAGRSTLARQAAHVLVTGGREFGFRSAAMASRTGQLLVVDALFIGVVQTLPGARDALRSTYAAVAPRPGRTRPSRRTDA
ncbi:MurR/RpiR family transcriptional regulator [Pengzhenrongella frigida]|uniref:MurR/RpiR family transcriptional regulator n=1 Tax=Pengzhenrongella frigida TaxID=1259133 RepID=A0A4Q5MWE7_9MICO|nr:MurR/RpiR family transcriptional regulator [Cellulomonas sp. HLT2-17]RYV49879.1 MurR/RpiR family transcriptional regulator [Cellulomonas sp. HLT2-17]